MRSTSLELLSNVFDNLQLGIVVLDSAGRVVIYNRAEELLAGRKRERVLGREFFVEVAPCMNVRALGGTFADKIGRSPLDLAVEFSFPFPFLEEPRDVIVKMKSFAADGAAYALLAVEDVSFQRSVDRMKVSLQSLVVHDLKNPLAAVIANLEFLKEEPALAGNQDALAALVDSLDASERLHAMLLNLLDVTRLETNSFPLSRTSVDVHGLIRQVADGNRAAARMRGSHVDVEPPSGAQLTAWLDEGAVRRALDNLVENATRFAKHVTLSARSDADGVVIDVCDDGPGIPEPVREAIFEKYAQVSDPGAVAARTDNRGLGLTFVRLAARAHGGDATVACPPGGGTRFSLRLPVAPPSARARPAP